MKIPILSARVLALALLAVPALGRAESPTAAEIVADVQDQRAADVQAVQAALRTASDEETRATIVAAFQVRDRARAESAGAASLQAELARQAAQAAPASATAPAPARETTTANASAK